MQDRYVGDFGDYIKLALLRVLLGVVGKPEGGDIRLGIAWWLVPDEKHNGDGRHIKYLEELAWRRHDPVLFDFLKRTVDTKDRKVKQLQSPELFPNCRFVLEHVPLSSEIQRRAEARSQWLQQIRLTVSDCDLVFIDPDNGLATEGYSVTRKAARKSVAIEELALLCAGRSLLVYHHQTRRKGGHYLEIDYLSKRLRDAGFET